MPFVNILDIPDPKSHRCSCPMTDSGGYRQIRCGTPAKARVVSPVDSTGKRTLRWVCGTHLKSLQRRGWVVYDLPAPTNKEAPDAAP